MTVYRYLTQEWMDEVANVYNSDPENAETFAALETTLSFKIKAKSSWGIEKDILFATRIERGNLEWVKLISESDAQTGDFVVSATPDIWKKIIRGETGFITAIMTLKLKVEHGTKQGIFKLGPYAKPLLNLMGKVELQFPDEMSNDELEKFRTDITTYRESFGL